MIIFWSRQAPLVSLCPEGMLALSGSNNNNSSRPTSKQQDLASNFSTPAVGSVVSICKRLFQDQIFFVCKVQIFWEGHKIYLVNFKAIGRFRHIFWPSLNKFVWNSTFITKYIVSASKAKKTWLLVDSSILLVYFSNFMWSCYIYL